MKIQTKRNRDDDVLETNKINDVSWPRIRDGRGPLPLGQFVDRIYFKNNFACRPCARP